MRKFIIALFVLLMSFLLSAPETLSARMAPDLERELRSAEPDDIMSVIVTFSDEADLELYKFIPKEARREEIIKDLRLMTEGTLSAVNALLKETGTVERVQPLWIINGIAITARVDVIRKLAEIPLVEGMRLDKTINRSVSPSDAASAPEWNLDMIRAPELWSLGITGQNIVVAVMDSGVDLNHPELAAKWRGGDNSWFDPRGEYSKPADPGGHGVKVAGIIVGGSESGSAIGVAPGAKWIGVKLFDDEGNATLSDIHLSYQWILDPDGDPATDDAPDIVNSSWSVRNRTGECFEEFRDDMRVLRAAGIAVVFSAGNDGPSPNTSKSPANYPESFSVGSMNEMQVDGASSRGPSACGSGVYPNVVAPGEKIFTSDRVTEENQAFPYTFASGTSFAAPHVAGAMALLKSAVPDATVDELESALTDSAVKAFLSSSDKAKNDTGYGLIDVLGAYEALLERRSSFRD